MEFKSLSTFVVAFTTFVIILCVSEGHAAPAESDDNTVQDITETDDNIMDLVMNFIKRFVGGSSGFSINLSGQFLDAIRSFLHFMFRAFSNVIPINSSDS